MNEGHVHSGKASEDVAFGESRVKSLIGNTIAVKHDPITIVQVETRRLAGPNIRERRESNQQEDTTFHGGEDGRRGAETQSEFEETSGTDCWHVSLSGKYLDSDWRFTFSID